MAGMVEPFASITPERVVLAGQSDEVIEKAVTIQGTAKYPFSIRKARARRGSDISFTITGNGEPCCRKYLLQVVNVRARPGRYADTIILETDSAIQPALSVAVIGNIK